MGKLIQLATAYAAAQSSALSPTESAFLSSAEQGRAFSMPGSTLSAGWLTWLLHDREANEAVGAGGVCIKGDVSAPVLIAGAWCAPHAKATFPLAFEHVQFDQPIDLSFSELSLLSFEETRTRSIDLRGSALGWLRFRRNSSCDGGINLTLARLERGADFTSSSLNAGSGIALAADWLRANGPLNCWSRAPQTAPFTVHGVIRLYGARIGGELNCRSAVLHNPGAVVMNMDQCTVEGSAAFAGANLVGALSMVGAEIEGDFIGEGMVVRDGQYNDVRKTVFALVADHSRIAGSAYLRRGFRAEGMVRLYGASIGCDLECHGGAFINPAQAALMAEGLRLGGSLHFANSERSDTRCHIEGVVRLNQADITGALLWRKVEPIDRITLELRSTKVATLDDEPAAWPVAERLDLQNFAYETIAEGSPVDAVRRVDWLRRSRGFSHQAYDQLAAVLKRQGRYADARDIMFAKEERYASEAPLALGDRWWYGIKLGPVRVGFGPLAGYGYQLKWAFLMMLLTVLLCGAVYMTGHPALMRKTSDQPAEFQSLMYSVDVFVPVIDFGQSAWEPDPNKGIVLLHGMFGDLRTGGLLLAIYWAEIVLGWAISSVLVGTVTARLVRD